MSLPAPFEIERTVPPHVRLAMAAIGLFALALPVWEYREALLHPAWNAAGPLAVTAAAWAIGGFFIATAVLGDAQRWRFEGARLTVERRSLLRRAARTYRPDEIASVDLYRERHRKGSDTFLVRLTLVSGDKLETSPYKTAAEGQQMEAKIRLALDLTGRA